MHFTKLASLVSFVALALAAPAPAEESHLEARALDTVQHCGQWDTIVASPYTLYVNQWGKSGATSGQSCGQFVSLSGSTASFKNAWTWAGGNGIKSYTNLNLNTGIGKQLSAIKSIPSSVKWSISYSGSIVANVAYDLFTSDSAGGSNKYEIMIWLANYNAGPISYNYGADGKPVPVATNVSLGGKTWNLYYGSNGANYVYSFLPVSGTVTSLSADLKTFLTYLTSKQTLPASQYLTTLQIGSEPTTGSATITYSSYSAAIN